MKLKKIFIYSLFLLGGAGMSSCEDFFNPGTEDTLLEKDYVGAKTELYSGYWGIASLMMDVADQAVFLEGLRGDFLEPTTNAGQELWDIYNYEPNLQGNSHADPKGYYAIINGANDYLAHLREFQLNNPNALSAEIYAGLGGGAIRFKVWAYMMLAKIYGEALIIDEPITSYVDINKFEKLNLDGIFGKCIEWMTVGDMGYVGTNSIRWSVSDALLVVGSSESASDLEWNRITPYPQCLLAELYLWNNQYEAALQQCISIISEGAKEKSYLLNKSEWNAEWTKFGYQFTRMEHMTVAFYKYEQFQTNRLIKYFSNQFPNQYLLKPTEVAMKRFNDVTLPGGGNGDTYRGKGRTFKEENGEWVVQKFLAGHSTDLTIYRNDVLISLYRSSDIYLFMCEALNNLERFEEAQIFLNGGIEAYFNSTLGCFVGIMADKGYPTELYAASGNQSCCGVRGRISVSSVGAIDKFPLETQEDRNNYRAMMDSVYVEEAHLESAGESRGYYAMIRNFRRYPQMQQVWAEKVAAKYSDPTRVESLLKSDVNNWFIKYDLSE